MEIPVLPLTDVKIRLPQFNLTFICRKQTDDIWIINPNFEKKILTEIMNFRGRTFVDVGAHIGKYSLLVAKKNPKSKVISIEADSDNFGILEENIQLNGLKNMLALNLAAYYKDGIVKLYKNYSASSIVSYNPFLSHKKADRKARVQAVKTKKLDDILNDAGIGNVDTIKIDVEGRELEVLMGATKTLKGSKNLVIFFEAMDKKHLEKVETILRKFGYKIKAILPTMYQAYKSNT